MKTLYKYLIKNFLVPFSASLVIVMFVLVMQILWLAFDDIAGKGISFFIILKFVWYTCLLVSSMALPISVLLSSIMTMGNLGEHYEYAAIKAAGISYFKFLRPLLVAITILTFINYLLLNYTLPYASLKQKNLLLNIKKTQPTLALIEGSFNDEIPGWSIKFSKKYGPDNSLLKDVLIIDTSGNKEDQINITAKRGEITTEEGSKYMTLILEDGYYFKDHTNEQSTKKGKAKHPSSLAKFDKYTVNIDISSLTSHDLEQEKYKHHYTMQNTGQLQKNADSLKVVYDKYINTKFKSMQSNLKIKNINKLDTIAIKKSLEDKLLDNFDIEDQVYVVENALRTLSIKTKNISSYKKYFKQKRKNLNNHDYQYHYILASSISCLLLFFIGISLGSIIRKGGFGMPMVMAIIIYVIYHFTNTFGKNLAEESSVSALVGGWLGTIIMGPVSIFFTYRASKDLGFINFDFIIVPIKKIINRFQKKDE